MKHDEFIKMSVSDMSFFNNVDLIFRQRLEITTLSFYQSYKIYVFSTHCFHRSALNSICRSGLVRLSPIPNLFLSSRLPGIVCLDVSSSSSYEPDLKWYNPQSSSNMFSVVFGWFLLKKNQSKKLKLWQPH